MQRLLAAFVYAALLSLASACSCVPPEPFPNCDASIVLYGKALSNTPIKCTSAADEEPIDGVVPFAPAAQTLVKFKVTAVLKAPQDVAVSAGDVVNVRSYVQSATCGYQMQAGIEYILFPSPSKPPACEAVNAEGAVDLAANSCAPNIQNPTDEQVQQLAKECGATLPLSPCQQSCYARCDRRCGV